MLRFVIFHAAFSHQSEDEGQRHQVKRCGMVVTDGAFGVEIFINLIIYEKSREGKEGIG